MGNVEKVSKELVARVVVSTKGSKTELKTQAKTETSKTETVKKESPTVSKPKSGLSIFLKGLIETGTMNQKEIATKIKEQFPQLDPSTISTLLTDSINPKYNKSDKLVVLDEKGNLKFSK